MVIAEIVKLEKRMMALAVVAASNADIQEAIYDGNAQFPGGSPDEVRRSAEIYVDDHKTPLSDGLTHKNPQYAGDRIRHPEGVVADRPRGPFQPLAPTIAEARHFLRAAAMPAPW